MTDPVLRPDLSPEPPRRSTGKTVAGGLLAAFAALMVLSLLGQIVTGSFHLYDAANPARGVGAMIGVVAMIALPAWGASKLLGSHRRELAQWEEQRRQRRLTGGW